MGAVAGEEKDFISGEQMWRQTLENSPIVQFRTAFAGLNVELMNLGSNVLPFVTNALKKANETLGGKGELALIGAGVMGWFNRGSIWKAIKGIGGGVLGAVNLPWAIDQMTGGLDDIPNGHAPTNPYWPFPPPGSGRVRFRRTSTRSSTPITRGETRTMFGTARKRAEAGL